MRRVLLLLVVAAPAFAWESVCTKYANPTLDVASLFAQSGSPCLPSAGPETAHQRWIGPYDEHRQLWELTRGQAGLPLAVSDTVTLPVFTGDAQLDAGVGLGVLPTYVPAPLDQVKRIAYRSTSVGEFAQLPDFSYALWDWASGHETCPLAGAASIDACHDFASHMGPVNSNHFPPQSQRSYAHYHQLALDRAAQCRDLSLKLAGLPQFTAYAKACELEALTFEAIGQHFLQDSWSMGHMWERWGSATLTDFPGADTDEQRDRAVLVALVAGFFHGARGVLQALPTWTSYDVDDAMCAPWDIVRYRTPAGDYANGIGDDYLDRLPDYPLQSSTLFQCAVSGLLEVYTATGQVHGAAQPAAGFVSVDPTSDACFGQRATNAAIAAGAAINLKIAGLQTTIPVDARFVSFMLPKVARAEGKVPVTPKLRNEFRFELQRVVTIARLRAKDDPDGTTLASGQWGPFMGVQQNGQYPTVPDYEDPALPWDGASEHAQYLQRTFHRAHAAEWCAQLSSLQLDGLKLRAQSAGLSVEERVAACGVCAEFAVRHMRLGNPGAWDQTQEPLCHALTSNPAYVYFQSPGVTDPVTAANRWCCP